MWTIHAHDTTSTPTWLVQIRPAHASWHTPVGEHLMQCASAVCACTCHHGRTLCNPHEYETRGKKAGNFQNKFYEEHVKQHVLMYLNKMGLTAADLGLVSHGVPPLFIHNTEDGVAAMCETLGRRAERMTEQLMADDFKVLMWGFALPYHHYVFV